MRCNKINSSSSNNNNNKNHEETKKEPGEKGEKRNEQSLLTYFILRECMPVESPLSPLLFPKSCVGVCVCVGGGVGGWVDVQARVSVCKLSLIHI